VSWIYLELVLVSLAAMLSPTTLTFSVLALVLGDRPLRTGFLFYLGALTATLAIGVLAAFVIGDLAASPSPSSPKTWVAIIDVVAGAFLIGYVTRAMRQPVKPEKVEGMVNQMSKIASSPAIAVVGAGAVLANPGGFIPLALKTISETDPSATQYIAEWVFFTLMSLLPLAVALVMLLVARDWAERVLGGARDWLVRNAVKVAGVIVILFSLALIRNGISGLVN
jgi:uncharacterized membrane protein